MFWVLYGVGRGKEWVKGPGGAELFGEKQRSVGGLAVRLLSLQPTRKTWLEEAREVLKGVTHFRARPTVGVGAPEADTMEAVLELASLDRFRELAGRLLAGLMEALKDYPELKEGRPNRLSDFLADNPKAAAVERFKRELAQEAQTMAMLSLLLHRALLERSAKTVGEFWEYGHAEKLDEGQFIPLGRHVMIKVKGVASVAFLSALHGMTGGYLKACKGCGRLFVVGSPYLKSRAWCRTCGTDGLARRIREALWKRRQRHPEQAAEVEQILKEVGPFLRRHQGLPPQVVLKKAREVFGVRAYKGG